MLFDTKHYNNFVMYAFTQTYCSLNHFAILQDSLESQTSILMTTLVNQNWVNDYGIKNGYLISSLF